MELNGEILKTTLKLLKIRKEIKFTPGFIAKYENADDLREIISPKQDFKADKNFHPERYLQVFEDRHGFIPNLSIIDLLCCAGPQAGEILRASNAK